MKIKTGDITLAAMFAALMAIGANVTSFIVIGGVPITLTTFFCVLAGLLLGGRLGAISMIVYALVGLVGAPVFAGLTGGPAIVLKPTFGFILSYIMVAYVVGRIVEMKSTRKSFILAGLVGMVINYVVGTNWMYFAYKYVVMTPFDYSTVWAWMLAPLPKDIILSAFAGTVAYRISGAVSKSKLYSTIKPKKAS